MRQKAADKRQTPGGFYTTCPVFCFFVFENFFEKFLIYPRKTLARYAAS